MVSSFFYWIGILYISIDINDISIDICQIRIHILCLAFALIGLMIYGICHILINIFMVGLTLCISFKFFIDHNFCLISIHFYVDI